MDGVVIGKLERVPIGQGSTKKVRLCGPRVVRACTKSGRACPGWLAGKFPADLKN